MAKGGETNFLVQHIEKIVLAICICLFVFVLIQFVASSPRQGGGMAPAQVDKKILDQAQNKQDSYQREKPTVENVPDFLKQFEDARKGSFQIDQTINLTPPTKGINLAFAPGESQPIALADITPIPQPGKPLSWAGWEVPSNQGDPADEVTCHVVAVYPWAELVKKWNSVLKDNPRIPVSLVAVAVKAEIQQMNQDGSWSPAKNANVTTPMMYDSRGSWIGPPALPAYDGIDVRPIRQAVALMSDNKLQELILQPEYFDIWRSSDASWGSWAIHLPKTTVHDIKADSQTNQPIPSRSAQPGRSYDPESSSRRSRGRDEGGRESRSYDPEAPRRRSRSRDEGGRESRSYEQSISPSKTESQASKTGLVSLYRQKQSGQILLWIHDNSLEPMKAYRYRIQLSLVNPLFTYDREVKNKEDATIPTIESPWSEWSDTVFIPNTNEFHLIGQNPDAGEVRIQVYGQALGQRLRKNFPVALGEKIGKRKPAKVVDLITGQRVSREVNFDTGSYAVHIDFDKEVYVNNLPRPQKTAEVIFLDANGQLRSKLLALDDDSDRQKQLIKQTKDSAPPPPKAQKRNSRRPTRQPREGRSRRNTRDPQEGSGRRRS